MATQLSRRAFTSAGLAWLAGGCAIDLSGSRMPTASSSFGCALSADGRWVARSLGDTVNVRDLRTARSHSLRVPELLQGVGVLPLGHRPIVVGAATAAGGTVLAVREAATGAILHATHTKTRVNTLALSGTCIAAATDDGLLLWDLPSDRTELLLRGRVVVDLAFAPDGRHAIVVTRHGRCTVRLVDLHTGASRTPTFVPAFSLPSAIALSEDGRWLALGRDERDAGLLVVDLQQRVTTQLPQRGVTAVLFDAGRMLVASGSLCAGVPSRLHAWTLPKLRADPAFASFAWAPDDEILAMRWREPEHRIIAATNFGTYEVDPSSLAITATVDQPAFDTRLCG